jgi:hypothetical protein
MYWLACLYPDGKILLSAQEEFPTDDLNLALDVAERLQGTAYYVGYPIYLILTMDDLREIRRADK